MNEQVLLLYQLKDISLFHQFRTAGRRWTCRVQIYGHPYSTVHQRQHQDCELIVMLRWNCLQSEILVELSLTSDVCFLSIVTLFCLHLVWVCWHASRPVCLPHIAPGHWLQFQQTFDCWVRMTCRAECHQHIGDMWYHAWILCHWVERCMEWPRGSNLMVMCED